MSRARTAGRPDRAVLLATLTEPTSTTGLARRRASPNSTAIEHLTVLRDAGLARTRQRAGRFR